MLFDVYMLQLDIIFGMIQGTTKRVSQMETEFDSVKRKQQRLTCNVDKEITAMREQQRNLSERVDRNVSAVRNQQSRMGSIKITTEGIP